MSSITLFHWVGRFENRMHQYAYGVTYAKLRNVDFVLGSDWEGTKLFKNQHHKVLDNPKILKEFEIARPERNNNPGIFFDILKKHNPEMQRIRPETSEGYRYESKPVAFESPCCYQQGDTRSKVPTIYIPQSKSHLLEVFEFSDEVKECEAYKYWEARKGTYDVAHLRRGDIAVPRPIVAGVNNYSVISMESYYRAFEKYGFDKNAMERISDDNTNTLHKDRPVAPILGWAYPVGSNYEPGVIFDWLEDFLKLYFARTVFRANSSFSWWACFLSPYATTYSPYLDKKIPYGETMQETDFEFVPGNATHWYYKGDEFEPWRISIID